MILPPPVNGIGYSRDVGRSSILGGRVVWEFGDTFCKDETGRFLGVVSHTSAAVPDLERPLCTMYQLDCDKKPKRFIPLTEEEAQFEKEVDKHHSRLTFWGFGGIAHYPFGSGWAWFEKGKIVSDVFCQSHAEGLSSVSDLTFTLERRGKVRGPGNRSGSRPCRSRNGLRVNRTYYGSDLRGESFLD